MKLEDESLLSAYIDGQLDPDQLLVVESALLSNPQLAEQLRSLTSLRDLVGGLSRDASIDVSFVVLKRIQAPRRRWARLPMTISWHADRRRVVRAAGLMGIAAVCGIVATVALNFPRASRQPSVTTTGKSEHLRIASTIQRHAPIPGPIREEAVPGSVDKPSLSESSASGGGAPGAIKIGDSAHPNAASDIHDLAESPDLQHVRELLDDPKLRRFFLVRGGRDGAARQQVASVVEQTTHFGYYKITISNGIVIDPRHPEEATVFALLVSPKELDNLTDRLNAALPDSVEETPVDPRIVTQLADIGQVQACPATPIVTIPADSLAMRTKGSEGRDHAPADVQTVDKQAAVEQEQSGPVSGREQAQLASRSPNREPTPKRREDMIVVLVWVTRSPSG